VPAAALLWLFEAFVMLLAEQMPVAAIARLVQEEDTRLWRLISRLVEAAHAAADWSQVSSIAIDETSSRRGRCYVSVFLDVPRSNRCFGSPVCPPNETNERPKDRGLL
jgi:transposase